ncbi:MAG: tetratricopeptide repeat protein [Candidatus Latescibacteria bacterium]|nr:tetratricopeptide repeat protein [Candidatus Latescibacterota bacterium]
MSERKEIINNRIIPWFPWIVGGIAVVVRFFYLWSFWNSHPFSQKLISDARIFDDWALRIAAGDWLSGTEVFVLPPLYAYAMGIVYAVFGHVPEMIAVLQAAAGCVSAVLVYRLGARHFGVWAGLIAGLLFVGYGPQMFYEGMLLGNSGAVFLCLFFLTLVDNTGDEVRDWRWGLAGVVFGLTALMRPNVLSAIPFVMIGVWRCSLWPREALVRAGAFFLGGLMLPLVLCGLRNGLVADDWVLTTAHGGINFYMGNHANAPGWFAAPPEVDAQITPEGVQGNYEGPKRVAEAALGRSLKASEVSSFWFSRGLDFWFDDPVGALKVTLRKVRLFMSGYEVPLNYNFYYQRQYSVLLQISKTELWVLFPLAIVGMVVAARRFDRHAVLYLWVVGYAVGVIAFHVSSRYRTPVIPFVMMFAGFGIWTLVGWIQKRQWKPLGITIGALLILWVGYRVELNGRLSESNFGLDPFNLGTSYLWANENERALALLEEAEAYKQGDASLYYNLGLAYVRVGQIGEAKKAYGEALARDPDMVRAYVNLGNISFREGAYREAITSYREALERDINSHNARANMGWAYLSLGQVGEARKAWIWVLQRAPGHPSAKAGMERLGK